MVALDPDQLPPGGSALVCHLSLHGLGADRPAFDPMAQAALAPWRKRLWPHGDNDRWASPLLAAGFVLILIWEEVWNLENTLLSSCLLLLSTAGAVVGSLLFKKRFWCRYLCPMGGMNGLFAKLSILELRAEAGTCGGSCSSYVFFKGGPTQGGGARHGGLSIGQAPGSPQ